MNKRINALTSYIILGLGIIIYWLTAYPTIAWWDTSEYAAATVCFGLTGAPGSIIMTTLGWLSIKVVPCNPAYVLNLLAGLIGALTIFASFKIFKKVLRLESNNSDSFRPIENFGLIVASLIIISSLSLWDYSTMFTPYILTALFTMLILWAVLKWWDNANTKNSWKNIFWITLLLGVDFSVHRTNSVLIPGIILMMLIRNYKFILNPKSYLAAFSGIIIGLSLQLLYIPMSLNDPIMNLGATNDLQSWWNFISLKQYGGSFLLDIIVRKGPFWTYQVPYYFERFAEQYFYLNKSTLFLGCIPVILGVIGIIYLFKINKRIGFALVSFFVVTVAVSIIYFNLPEHYFRTIYRHYLPTFTIFSIFIFAGVYYLVQLLTQLVGKKRIIITSLLFAILIATVFAQLSKNLPARNNSNNWITYNHAKNILQSVDKNGILFSDWDNTIWPELYIQIAEKYRPDITQCNSSLSNLDWYLKQIKQHDKNFPFEGDGFDIKKIFYSNWKTINCSIALDSLAKNEYKTRTEIVQLSLPPLRNDSSVMLQDIVLFDIIKNNKWKRPIYFIKQGFGSELKEWLKPFLIDEGLVYKLVPDSSLKTNTEVLENNLTKYNIDCFNNNSIYLDGVSVGVGNLYYGMFIKVINRKLELYKIDEAEKLYKQMIGKLPTERLNPDKEVQKEINGIKNEIYVR